MKHCVLLSLLLALGCVHINSAPIEEGNMEQGSCEDASAVRAAKLALTKINQVQVEGYIFSLHRLSNVHIAKHGDVGEVFYLTLDVVETNCSVLSRKDWRACEARPTHDTPVYGQCKSVIYISRVHRVEHLYKYNCVVRPVPAARVSQICPDCPSLINPNNDEIQKTVSLSLEKFNKENGLVNNFALLNITRATAGMAVGMYYHVEYTIQETTCAKSQAAVTPDKCPIMECEFAHKGFCKGSLYHSPTGEGTINVDCEIYEPEAAEREKKLHLLGGETDHSHNDSHTHDHDHAHAADHTHSHDHVHDHTKSHAHHSTRHADDHHHTHDHDVGGAHSHAHDHSHDHGHGHDHVHTHHAKAHNHTGDAPNQHHDYKHADGMDTHEHDHELALDHDHKHAHLHEHEHHHHHHDHHHNTTSHNHPEGTMMLMPAMDQIMSSPDAPAGGPKVQVTMHTGPDHHFPGHKEPTIKPFPTTVSAQCPPPPGEGTTLVEKLFTEDPMFKSAA